MKADIMDTKPSKKTETTMLEINDTGRQNEYNGISYLVPFISLIQSLGYEVESESFFNSLIISGVKFYVDVDSASFMSKNAYTRERYERKPQNRFVTLRWGSHESNYILKVFINKETPVAKLKMKIDKAIEWHNNRQQHFADTKIQNDKNTETVALHYLKSNTVKDALRHVVIEQGKIQFVFKGLFDLTIKADGTLESASLRSKDMKSLDEVEEFANSILTKAEAFESVVKIIIAADKLSGELIEWAGTQYNRYFYIETMSTENKY